LQLVPRRSLGTRIIRFRQNYFWRGDNDFTRGRDGRQIDADDLFVLQRRRRRWSEPLPLPSPAPLVARRFARTVPRRRALYFAPVLARRTIRLSLGLGGTGRQFGPGAADRL
jgi:hypothetical protein